MMRVQCPEPGPGRVQGYPLLWGRAWGSAWLLQPSHPACLPLWGLLPPARLPGEPPDCTEFNPPAGKHALTFPRLCPVTWSRSQALRAPPTLSPKPPVPSVPHPCLGFLVCEWGGRARDQLSPQKRASRHAGRWHKPLMAGPQKMPLSPARSLPVSPPGTLPQNPLPLSAVPPPPGLTSHSVEPGASPATWQGDWGQEGWQRQARLGVSRSRASACLGFCICKMGTVALAPSCRRPHGAQRHGARHTLALPRLCYWHRRL